MNGYDGSVMGSLNGMPEFHKFFNVGMQGAGIGLVFAIYTVGNILGSFVAGAACDIYGRRFGMFIGSCFIVIGTIVQATPKAGNLAQFQGGRFLVGFGVPIAVTSAPVYLVEMAFPTWRGIFGGLYNVVGYYVGAIIASWTAYGTNHLTNNWSWRIPIIIQAVPSLIVIAFVWTIPESPRYLYATGKAEQARAILTKYHGNGNPSSAIVELECTEIEVSINFEAELLTRRWYDYRFLFNSRSARYRIWLVMLTTVFTQFIGGSVISYYLVVIINDVGITSSNEQLLLNSLNTVFSFLGGIAGAFTVDLFGRRPLLLWGTLLTGLIYIPINVIAAQAAGHVATGTGYVFIAFIFLYGIVFSFCWTPLQALYPAEILNNDIRAKGMAFQGFMGGLASFINTYATPVALKNIGWKTYTIFLIFHMVELVLLYFFAVETKGRSLEQIEEIFNAPKPVKKSMERTEVIVRKGEGVKMEMETI